MSGSSVFNPIFSNSFRQRHSSRSGATQARSGNGSVPMIPGLGSRARSFAAAIFVVFLGSIAPPSATAQAAEEYRLGVQDKLHIRVGQWRAAEGVYENWAGIGGEYAVGPNGMLSLALAGSVPAEGRTIAEVAEDISLRVQRQIGLVVPPETSIEIVEFRPIYVVGAVNSPGEFRYRPQMTVLQAVGMAGGHLRITNVPVRPERAMLLAVRDYEVMKLRRWSLQARLARLNAEFAGAQEVETPAEFADVPDAKNLLQAEAEILMARTGAVTSKQAAIKELRQLLEVKIEKLGEEIDIHRRQLALARKELKKVQSLMERGLTVGERVANAQRTVMDLEARRLDLDVAKLGAEQQLNEAVRDELDLLNERRRLIVTELQETGGDLDEVEVRLQAAKALVSEASSLGGASSMLQVELKPTYRLSRSEGSQSITRDVGEQDPINPGDTLQVVLPQIEPAGASATSPGLPR